jgi:stage V sporulation protein G
MKLHADIAHPINAKCRRKIQETILRAFREEVERSKEPGYKPVSFEDDAYQSDESQDE